MKNKPPQPQPAGTRRLRPGEIIRRGDVYLRHDGVWIETGTAFIGSEARAGGLEFARRSGPRFSRLVCTFCVLTPFLGLAAARWYPVAVVLFGLACAALGGALVQIHHRPGTGGRRRVRLRVTGVVIRPKQGNKHIMIQASCNNREYVELSVTPTDLEEKPVALDADALQIEVVEGDGTARVVKEGDAFRLQFISGAALAKTRFKVKGDAQPGEGVEIIEEEVELSVVSDKATTLGLAFLKKGLKTDLPPETITATA